MNDLINRFFAWIMGVVKITSQQKKEIRGDGGKDQSEIIRRWWN